MLCPVAEVEDVRGLGSSLERSYPAYVRGRLRFRVGQIVYVAFSLDETEMGFAFPKEERAALVEAEPDRFHLPRPSELRFGWVESDLATLDPTEAREFVVDAWRMVVPKKLSRAYDLAHPEGPGLTRCGADEPACKPDPVPTSLTGAWVATIHLGPPSPAGSSGLPAGLGRAALGRPARPVLADRPS
ncbi:hypothetical protein Acsp06_36620 [Actinomycetospora sp. NBRC 106375]|nr:hypothetical protein Acsp06_36620 [Actinomycetospora sp. NBRC 106375]